MPAYEAMLILKPSLKEEEQKAILDQMENVLRDNQAKIEASQTFGRRVLAYDIKKCKEGLYYLINFSSPTGQVVAELKRVSSLNENVLRVLLIEKKPVKAKR